MSLHITDQGTVLNINLNATEPGGMRFHACWLRDNSLHPETRSAGNGQRLITLEEQAADIRVSAARWLDTHTVGVTFSDAALEHPFPLHWLEQHRYDYVPDSKPAGWTAPTVQCWDARLVQKHALPSAGFPQLAADPAALHDWLAAIDRLGFALVTDLPDHPDALLEVVNLFGYVRETNYGKVFEVRSEVNPVNLAYTTLGLQAHTDNPYRDPVPTLQLLACVRNEVTGGESIVVDGFQAARQLQQENPEHFALLSRYCARFQYAGSQGTVLASKRPMIELGPDGELLAVRFNNRSAAPFTDIPFAVMPAFYQAYRHFADIINRPENQLSFRLRPRELFIVDNCRVLHSRTAFSGSGKRWLRGCYADKDGLRSTLRALEQQLGQQSAGRNGL